MSANCVSCLASSNLAMKELVVLQPVTLVDTCLTQMKVEIFFVVVLVCSRKSPKSVKVQKEETFLNFGGKAF